MTVESEITWAVLAAALVLNIGYIILAQTDRFQNKQVFQFWQRVGLPMGTEQIAVSVRRRLRRSVAAALAGVFAGLLVAAGILFFTEVGDSAMFSWLVLLPAALIGMTFFDVGMSLRDTLFRQPSDTPRVARAEAISLRDYISPWRLRAVPGLLLLAIILNVVGLVMGSKGVIRTSVFLQSWSLLILLVAVLVLISVTAVAQRILRQTQPAADVLELAWDDAIRADTFRKLGLLGVTVSWLAVAAAGTGILAGFDAANAGNGISGLGVLLFSWGYAATIFIFNYGGAQNYFRHRLWPNLTAASVAAGESS